MKENARDRLKHYGQEKILEFVNEKNKDVIEEQILSIDFEEIKQIYEMTTKKEDLINDEIAPIDFVDKEKIAGREMAELRSFGEDVIKNNKYAVVTMAGGQGTRLGFDKPKGAFKLDIGNDGKYIFQILAETLEKSKEKYDVLPYWYIMTSNQNDIETKNFFEENNYFGYEKEKIAFFKQKELPMLTTEGSLVIEDDKIKMGANGNGGVYESMKKEKVIDDMKNKNIEWVYICGVDNIMVNPIDPVFIGLPIKNHTESASKSVAKAYPEEKVGAFCKRNGKPSIVEYIELTENMREKCDENGELIYGEANIVSHLLNINAIEKIANQNLNYHIAVKKGLYKFETFIFDGFQFLDDMKVMRVKREEEFAPIKNKEGVDSPESAVEIYKKFNKIDKAQK